ncbi:chaperone protein ClpB3 chloroplastic-like protein [Tanacetum coccineum]
MMYSWVVVCDVWYIDPQKIKPKEAAIQFAERVSEEATSRKVVAAIAILPESDCYRDHSLAEMLLHLKGSAVMLNHTTLYFYFSYCLKNTHSALSSHKTYTSVTTTAAGHHHHPTSPLHQKVVAAMAILPESDCYRDHSLAGMNPQVDLEAHEHAHRSGKKKELNDNDDEDSESNFDEQENMSFKVCGLLPHFCLKGSIGLLNPVECQDQNMSVSSANRKCAASSAKSQPARVASYEHKSPVKHQKDETVCESESTEATNQLNSRKLKGTELYDRLPGRGTSNNLIESLPPRQSSNPDKKRNYIDRSNDLESASKSNSIHGQEEDKHNRQRRILVITYCIKFDEEMESRIIAYKELLTVDTFISKWFILASLTHRVTSKQVAVVAGTTQIKLHHKWDHAIASCTPMAANAYQGMAVGDGTTDVVLLAGKFSTEANPFIKDGVINKIKELAASIKGKTLVEKSNASNMETERCQPKRSHMGGVVDADQVFAETKKYEFSWIVACEAVLDEEYWISMISLTLDADTLHKTKAAGTPFYHDSLNKLKNATDYQKKWHDNQLSSLEVAKENKHQIVETGHLLKAMLEEKNGLARGIFSKADVD